ncbi:hypothetical protein [Aquimarina spongiae]|uniref:NlpE C-terminal OB domain-containing protein n=1 Tax=Aquimarina spongiae TaxID=570521 RepID=A0A1M6FEW7_9FLAO|nr:hypothetical protein [Aquimarina spongiae]SHI96207.1 hypothetical protein SAMN04488508_104250 [Aquimarina spongiae]
MKPSTLLIAVLLIISSCKKNNSENQNGEVTLIRGEFILIEDAAVIKGNDFIYGVVIDEAALELAEKIKPLQREEYDMVPVVIKGIIKSNPNQGWGEVVEIKEIVGVSAPTSELPTKIKASETQNTSEGN